jgi:hypothetical protein
MVSIYLWRGFALDIVTVNGDFNQIFDHSVPIFGYC